MVLLVAELNTDGIGVLATGGIAAFVLGALILFRPFQPDSAALPSLRVSPVLVGVMTVGMVAFFGIVVRQVVLARWSPLQTGYEQFIGQTAKVRRDIDPKGRVWFQGQSWNARTQSGETVAEGKTVEIVEVDNLTLVVEPVDSEDETESDIDSSPTIL
jgi:membrane-bound serine protease (ClpP class)